MKLATIYSEANIHPDLKPAMDQLTQKLVEQIRTAGVEIMPAHEDLTKARDTFVPGKGWEYTPGHRWYHAGRGGPSRWLVGYIKMGLVYVAVYLGLDGSVLTQAQYRYRHRAGEEPGIGQSYHRAFRDIASFMQYLHKKFKPFVSRGQLERFEEFVFSAKYRIKYSPPPAPPQSGLDDADEFYKGGYGPDADFGVVAAATALSKRILKGERVDPNNISVLIDFGRARDWTEHSGLDLFLPEYDHWIAANPKEAYIADAQGDYHEPLDWPKEAVGILINNARKISRTVVSRAQRMAKLAKDAPPPPL